MSWNDHPLLILKLLLLALRIRPDPGLGLEEGHENAWDVIILHHLVNDWHGERLHLVRDEADQAEAGHGALEVDVINLVLHLFVLCLIDHRRCALALSIWLDELTIRESLTLSNHLSELAIAVIN